MSYCRFRNTLIDFNDCIETLRDGVSDLSYEERSAALSLIKNAIELSEWYEDMDDQEILKELSKSEED